MVFKWFKKLTNSSDNDKDAIRDNETNEEISSNEIDEKEEPSKERNEAQLYEAELIESEQDNQEPQILELETAQPQIIDAQIEQLQASHTDKTEPLNDEHFIDDLLEEEEEPTKPSPVAQSNTPILNLNLPPNLPEHIQQNLTTVVSQRLNQDTKPAENKSYLQRLKQGLSKTRDGFADLFLGKKTLDQELVDELEMQLLTADVGIEATEKIIQKVSGLIKRNEVEDVDAVKTAMLSHMHELLSPYAQPLNTEAHKPFVILMTGINGAGKTTTIGKLAHYYQSQGKKVMLAAGDTFRAAAVEQLQIWGKRNNIPVIAQATGADAASVAYDALQSAIARQIDILIIDTAGRLHTQNHLMEELKKIKRVLEKLDPQAPHETMLVIDACNGQNALRQAQEFHQAMTIDGISITKLDGTAKGGILFAITHNLQLPIRFIGVGEQPQDLRPFNAMDFVNALLYNE